MAYSADADLAARIPDRVIIDLTDDEKSATSATTIAAAKVSNANIAARITAAITDADIIIDAHVRQRYDVPVTPAPALLTKLSADLAAFNLHSRRGSVFELPEWVTTKRSEALELLRGIAKATVDLGIDPPPSTSSKVVASADSTDRQFTQSTLEDF